MIEFRLKQIPKIIERLFSADDNKIVASGKILLSGTS